MQGYKFLYVAVMICATLVDSDITLEQPAELKWF